MTSNHKLLSLLAIITALLTTQSTFGAIVGPYTVDANTMHLFHFDEPSNPIADDPAVTNDFSLGSGAFDGGNPGTVGHASFSASFGTAGRTNRACCGVSTGIGSEERGWSQAGLVTAATLYGSDSTAFTFETLLKFNQLGNNNFTQIMRTQDAGLQLAYTPSGGNDFLTFKVPGGGGTYFSNPLTIDTSKWYHAAFVYDGVGTSTNNVRIYFTEMNEANTQAALVGTFSTGGIGINYAPSAFWVGGPSGAQLNGMFDEVRVSNIARAADDMMFTGSVPEPSSMALAGLGLMALAAWGWQQRAKN